MGNGIARSAITALLLYSLLPGCGSSTSKRAGDAGVSDPPDFSLLFPVEDLALSIDLVPGEEEDLALPEDMEPDPCLARARVIYTIDEDNMLRAFDPKNLKFINIGFLMCPAGGASPFSMGVDHNAVAWVLYNNGEIFQVDTQNAACKPTNFMPNQGDFNLFGMGFVADKKGQVKAEHLYVAGLDNMQLGVMDTMNLAIKPVGPINGNPELTGTGGAVLWAFFPDEVMPRVGLIDKATGAEGTQYMLGALAGTASAWAFAFWGGDFWIFLRRIGDNSTHVWHLESANGKVTDAVPNTGFGIVAGVSICAPTGPSH